jgi:hypothetical protein
MAVSGKEAIWVEDTELCGHFKPYPIACCYGAHFDAEKSNIGLENTCFWDIKIE